MQELCCNQDAEDSKTGRTEKEKYLGSNSAVKLPCHPCAVHFQVLCFPGEIISSLGKPLQSGLCCMQWNSIVNWYSLFSPPSFPSPSSSYAIAIPSYLFLCLGLCTFTPYYPLWRKHLFIHISPSTSKTFFKSSLVSPSPRSLLSQTDQNLNFYSTFAFHCTTLNCHLLCNFVHLHQHCN